jgi:hypothetical protein
MPILLIPTGLTSVPAAAAFPVVTIEAMFTGSAWTDVSSFYDSSGGGQITITRGSNRVESPVIRYDAGTCSIPLLNTDRRFDPANLAGPYVTGASSSTLQWLADGANTHTMFGSDAATTRTFFDNSRGFLMGGNPAVSPVQDGLAANPVLNYKSYVQFQADIAGSVINTGIFHWLLYDPESWSFTPLAEQQDPWTAMTSFCTLAHAHGFQVILTPGRDLGNTATARPKNPGETLDDWYIRTGIATTAAAVGDVFEVQDQANTLNLTEFTSFFTRAYNQAKASNAATPVWCGISTNYGTPQQMFNACVTVPQAQGFWLNMIGDIPDSLSFLRKAVALSTGAPRATQVQPMVPIRVSATFASVTYRLFNGTADSWTLTYSPPSDADVTVACTDGFKILAAQARQANKTFAGGGETTGARVTRILNDCNWPSAKRTIGTGIATLQPTLLGGAPVPGTPAAVAAAGGATTVNLQSAISTSAPLDELQLAADTEMGELYVNGNGFLVFRGRNALFTDTRSNTSQAQFGDDPAIPTAELPYATVNVAYDDVTLWNGAAIANQGSGVQNAADAGSQAIYTPHVYDSENLFADSDFQALSYAQYIVLTSALPELRFTDMAVDPRAQPTDLFPQVLGREIGDRITITRRPPGGGAPNTRDAFIRGIAHTITDSSWLTTWTLEDATSLPDPFILDDPARGVLDNSPIGF